MVPPVAGIVVDGDFADWPKDVEWHAIESPGSSTWKSLTARFAVGVDRARGLLNVAVDVTDDVIVLEGPGKPEDAQDGVEIYVDLPHRAARDLAAQYFIHKEFGVGNAHFAGTAQGVRRVGVNASRTNSRLISPSSPARADCRRVTPSSASTSLRWTVTALTDTPR